jgi:hypothetical protein
MDDNYYFNKDKINFCNNKRKRQQFKENIEQYFNLPEEIISKFTNNYIQDELMTSQILKKSKIEIINSNFRIFQKKS